MDNDSGSKEEQSNPCCLKWKEKYTKLKERHTKLDEGRNALRQGISIFEQQIAKMQKENAGLKKAYHEEKTRADNEKENKDKECDLRVNLETEISTLKSEILSLNQRGGQVAEDVSQDLECLKCLVSERETEINQLKDLVEKEKTRANAEITKAQKEKKKADESAKKVQDERSKVNDFKKVADMERKRAEELKLQVERLKSDGEESKSKLVLETGKLKQAKDMLCAEREKADAERKRLELQMAKAEKVQDERSKVNDFKKVADMERKRAEELKLQVERLKSDAEESKSKLVLETGKLKEAKDMLCAEREKADAERKRLELPMAKAEEQRKVAESNLKLAMTEKNRANLMSEQLDNTTQRLKELEKEMTEISSGRMKQASAGNELMGEITNEALKREINEKEACKKLEKVTQKLKKEKTRAEYERKKAEEQRQMAEKHKKASMEEKLHADQLTRELQHYKQKVEEMGKEIQKLESFSHPYSGSLMVETIEMKILKKQLKLEKIRLKHAKQIAQVEIGRNHLLRNETLLLKQELLKFSQRLDTLDSCLLRSYGGIDEPEKLKSLQLQRECIGVEACERNLHANGLTKTSATSSGTAVSALLEAEPTVSGLSGGTIKGNIEKLATRNVNIDGSHIAQTAKKTRKRLRETHESVEKHMNQQVVGKLSSPQGVLYHQTDKNPYENNKLVVAYGERTFLMDQSSNYKKMKSCTPALVDIYGDELKAKRDDLVLKQHNVCIVVPPEVDNLTTLTRVVNDASDEDFDEIFSGNILKLLDLDNDKYEERYRKAIQRPLSPTLPQIEFKSSHVPEICNLIYYHEGISNLKEELAQYCSFDVMNLEIDANNRDSSLPFKHLSNSTPANLSENDNNDQNAVSCIRHPLNICIAGTDSTVSGEQDRIVHTGNEDALVFGVFTKYCVVFSENTENSSISRVYLATSSCLTMLLDTQSTFLQNVLPCIWKADDLTAKERVSVFFSLLLHYISDVAAKADLGEKSDFDLVQLLKSFPRQICSVLSDASSRRLLMQINVQELFFLIEDFLLNGKIVLTDSLTVQEASIPLLLAGGVVLASICAATGHVVFLCEVSVNLLRIQLLNSWVIKIIHIFAYICGSNYFELEDRSFEISVLKCLVVNHPKHSTACVPSIFIDSSRYSSSASCPFSIGVASVDDMAVLLLDKVKVYVSYDETSKFCLEECVGYCIDILSLLELMACFMSWEWTRSNVVNRLVKIVESSVTEQLSTSIVTLLGQLGRIGIDCKGGVEEIRDWLCNSLINRSDSSKFGLHYEFAVGNALVGLIGTPFEEIVRSEFDSISQSGGSKCIREWFYSLNDEQMSAFRVLQDSSSKCKLNVGNV